MKDNELLQALKIQLAQYKTFDCKLLHENIIGIESNEGTDSINQPLEPIINRIRFCDRDFRSVVISCAHTTAAIKFKNLVEKISQQIDISNKDLHIKAFDDTLYEIYILDHKRGSLEKECALAGFNNKSNILREKFEFELSELVKQHSELIAKLELIRQAILIQLEQLIY